MRPCSCAACGHAWAALADPDGDGCPKCGRWKGVEIGRCYECPLTSLEEEMDSTRGALITRVFRKCNLMAAKVAYGPGDFTVEEARVLELIELERPERKAPATPR